MIEYKDEILMGAADPKKVIPYSLDLIKKLDSRNPSPSIHDLPDIAEDTENLVVQQLAHALKKVCLPGSSEEDHNLITLDNRSYEIAVGSLPNDTSQIGMSVAERAIDRSRHQSKPLIFKIPSSLRVQSVAIWLPENLKQHESELAAVATHLIRSASEWYEYQLMSSLARANDELISSLYHLLYALLPENIGTSRIWLATTTKGYGHYLLEPSVISTTLKDSSQRAVNLGQGPGALLSRFLNATVPLEQTWGLEAAKENRCIDLNFESSKYRADQADLFRAELAVFGGAAACIYPICFEGETFLIAVFPIEIKNVLIPILELSAADLNSRFQEARSRIQKIYRQINLNGVTGERAIVAARCAGAFAGELLNSLLPKLV
jgi:hypothetical protein